MADEETIDEQLLLVRFHPGTKNAVIQEHARFHRQNAVVAGVEILTVAEVAVIPRKPTVDGHADTTLRDGVHMFKGPSGAVLAPLTDAQRDVVRLLLGRVRLGLPTITDAETLFQGLKAMVDAGDRWTKLKRNTSATDAYGEAKVLLVGTGHDLVDEKGKYDFKWRYLGLPQPK